MTKRHQTLISPEELIISYRNDNTVIFDCRFYLEDPAKGRKEYMEGHIPGAVYLDLTHDLSSPVIKGITGRHPLPHPEILGSTMRAAGLDSTIQAVVYDQSNGAYASRAWWLLRWLGHEHVAVLDGGCTAWKFIHGDIDNQWTLKSPGHFQPRIQRQLMVNMNELDKMAAPLIDSREYRRYTGEYEPIDPVAGHIPGAICMPYMDNTDPTGRWKSKDELKEKFSGSIPESVIPVFYCGSGVTACHNILAYKIGTGKDAILYPGSWSEWINYNKV